jgi:hypothetical protein
LHTAGDATAMLLTSTAASIAALKTLPLRPRLSFMTILQPYAP